MITFVLATISFLDFSSKPNLTEITKRFGSPMTIEHKEESTQLFTYPRDSYIFSSVCDKKGDVVALIAYGVNKSVSYKGVRLTDDFKTIITKVGQPTGYEVYKEETIVCYKDCEFTLAKLGKKNPMTIVGIKVIYKPE